jgi:hypothetical protein
MLFSQENSWEDAAVSVPAECNIPQRDSGWITAKVFLNILPVFSILLLLQRALDFPVVLFFMVLIYALHIT